MDVEKHWLNKTAIIALMYLHKEEHKEKAHIANASIVHDLNVERDQLDGTSAKEAVETWDVLRTGLNYLDGSAEFATQAGT